MPKRITIRGDDEKEYKFLVKGGEDLRLDQRIEQVHALLLDLLVSCCDCDCKFVKASSLTLMKNNSKSS